MEKANIHVLIDGELKKEARIKTMREGTNLTAVITELLTKWVKGKKG